MKKVNLTISTDEEKVKALRLYLEKKDCKLEDEGTSEKITPFCSKETAENSV